MSHAPRKYGFALVAASITAMATMGAVAADKAKSIEDWEIRGEKGSVMTQTPYALFNLTNRKYVMDTADFTNKKLQWDNEHKPRTNPKPRVEFWRLPKEKTPGPLKYGEEVMIVMPNTTLFQGKASPTYLMYMEQEKGINLGLSGGGSEQWEIHGGPTGTPVSTNDKIALYNKRAKDYVIYAEREHGINLRWNKDVNKPRDHRKK